MSKFDQLLESQLNTTDLVRIRIKHDPANEQGELNDYVGYVLQEDGHGGVIAIVPAAGPEHVSLGMDDFNFDTPACDQPDSLGEFKQHVVSYLMSRGYHDVVKSKLQHIISANDVSQLEEVLKSTGCDHTGVLDMYRDFVSNEV